MFYVPAENKADIEQAVTSMDQEHSGMSLREYMAAAALQGILACPGEYGGANNAQMRAARAVQHADALLAELAK